MFGWLASFFTGFGSIFGLGNLVSTALIRITNTLLSLYKGWVSAAIGYAYWLRLYVNRVWRFGLGVVALLEHILFVVFPRAIAQAYNNAVTWAGHELTLLHNLLSTWIARVEAFAHTEITRLTALVTGWVNTIRTDLAHLWARFLAAEHLVISRLTDPRALADWIAGEILSAVGRWALARRELIARWLLHSAVTETEWFASLVESIVVKLFL